MAATLRRFACLMGVGTAVAVASGQTRPSSDRADLTGAVTTYCNPLAIPDYPVGKLARELLAGTPAGRNEPLWLLGRKEQFRELADVSVVWNGGKWYMYPSVDMAWVSDDCGRSWQHHPLNHRDIGYAPTVVDHDGKFLMMASGSPIYSSASPLGPFDPIGSVEGLCNPVDPMLFSNDDGRMYLYCNTGKDRVVGVELDAHNPTRMLGNPVQLISFDPARYPWQCAGDANEDVNSGWLEGAWVLKRGGVYYLTYSAAGTENGTYAVGCATAKSPLGPFTQQRNNPIQRNIGGLITGTGHGSFVEGPGGSLWAFYTLRAGVVHGWERRLGMDPAWIGHDGELHVMPASEVPMRVTGARDGAVRAGWAPLNLNRQTRASSTALNLSTRLTVDDDLRTWWQPEANDPSPALTSSLVARAVAHGIRIVWRDVGLDTIRGFNPGPFRYKVELETSPNTWVTVVDRSNSSDDLLVDYRECAPTAASAAKLVIVGTPAGITPGVAEFTVFGTVTKR